MSDILDEPTKTCIRCLRAKPLSEFGPGGAKGAKSGLKASCRHCVAAQRRTERNGGLPVEPAEYVTERRCPTCNITKPRDAFYISNHTGDGLRVQCKECARVCSRGNYRRLKKSNPRLLKAGEMTDKARRKAKVENLPFNIDINDVLATFGDKCPVLGITYNLTAPVLEDASPTLDKFYAHKGYVKGNVTVLSRLANMIKSKASTEQVEAVAKWMRAFEDSQKPKLAMVA